MNGVLVVNKPRGPTSHDVVARVRRAIGLKRVGHTGTLDPIATGVLPLVVGRATRLAQFFAASSKTYFAQIQLGRATDTYDSTGRDQPSDGRPVGDVPPAEIEEALQEFGGTFWQTPPPFSARKVEGARAYALARRQQRVEPKPSRVTVDWLETVSLEGCRLSVRLRCSAGFFVRSLAHDLGQALGCGACLDGLEREESGGFRIDESVPLDSLEAEGRAATSRLIPMSRLLPGMPSVRLTDQGLRRACHGNSVSPTDIEPPVPPLAATLTASGVSELRVRLLDREGELVAVAELAPGGILRPRIVLV